MFIARLYLDRAIALPSDSLNEPAIQPTDTISGARPTSHLGVYFSLSLSLSRILRALHTDPRARSSWDLRRVGHRHPLVERIEWIERISLRHFDEILLFLSAQFIFLRGSIDDDIVVACSEKFKCVSGRRKIGRIIKIT